MKFSVIIPAHDCIAPEKEPFFRRCLESVHRQDYPRDDRELIVICDNCSDDTDDLAAAYADKVVLIWEGNDGPARQAGVDIAQGDWVLFLDDDDWWPDTTVLKRISEVLDDDIDILLCGFNVPAKGPFFALGGYAQPIRVDPSGHYAIWPAVWNKCYRRTFIKETQFRRVVADNAGNAADIDWTNRLLQRNPRLGVLDESIYYYNYMRPGSSTYDLEQNGGINYER